MSQASALLTPVDLSPSRTPPNLKTAYTSDFGSSTLISPSFSNESQSPHLYDAPPPSSQSSISRHLHSDAYSTIASSGFPLPEPVIDQTSPRFTRRSFASGMPNMSQDLASSTPLQESFWGSRSSMSSEWLEPIGGATPFAMSHGEPLLGRAPCERPYNHNSNNKSINGTVISTNDVRYFPCINFTLTERRGCIAHQFSLFASSFFFTAVPSIRYAHY
jgi:hypothetical protein